MNFATTDIPGVVIVEPAPHRDERGSFARLYCPEEFRRAGIDFTPVQHSLSRNILAFTLRGLHYQNPPFAESKLVRVTRGRIFDVAVDLRADSPAFRRWVGVELDADTATALFVPKGCAHGFLTLEPETDVLYAIAPAFSPGHGKGCRWNDPAFAIRWPAAPRCLSPADAAWPLQPSRD